MCVEGIQQGRRFDLVRQETSALESRGLRIERRRYRMIRSDGTEGCDTGAALVARFREQVLEFAHFVAAVDAARQIVMLDREDASLAVHDASLCVQRRRQRGQRDSRQRRAHAGTSCRQVVGLAHDSLSSIPAQR